MTKGVFEVKHESEIPEAGDFVLRSIAQDSVIVSRTHELI